MPLFKKYSILYNDNYNSLRDELINKILILMKNGKTNGEAYKEILKERYENDINKIKFIEQFIFPTDLKTKIENIYMFYDDGSISGEIFRLIHYIFVFEQPRINIIKIYDKSVKKAYKIMEPNIKIYYNDFLPNFKIIQNEIFK